ncbi:MAG: chorismate synthase [Bacteriovoracaceae bacterium]|nr:chorismate synthase [Bacteriovoracaceae bacterium]
MAMCLKFGINSPMRGNTFGKLFSITTFGESHGVALGAVIDGVPAGLDFSLDDLQSELDRRRPGRLKVTTARDEADQVEVLSGMFEGKTLGTPIAVMVRNTNQRSQDYNKDMVRPGHGDVTYSQKFGHRDYRGGGRSSGRETLARVAGGYFAGLVLKNVQFCAYISQIGKYKAKADSPFETKFEKLHFGAPEKEKEIENYLLDLKQNGESAGGKVQLHIRNLEAGLGEPVFDKLKADLAKAMTSIGSCVGVTFGIGEDFVSTPGTVATQSRENFGGIEGGISNGEEIVMTLLFRAPSTVGQKAREGRHDPCILPRVLPVVEAMAKLTIADHYLRQNAYQI